MTSKPDTVELLEYLCNPMAEAMPDGERLTRFIHAGFDAAVELKALRTSLKECTDDLEASVNAEYHGTLDYPSQKRRFDRDMQPVLKARALLSQFITAPIKV